MEEIEIGEYGRSKAGFIAKLINTEKCLVDNNKIDYIFNDNIV